MAETEIVPKEEEENNGPSNSVEGEQSTVTEPQPQGESEGESPTEPPVLTEPTEPPVTTEPTEPPVTTEPTEPPVSTEPIEPPVTTESTEPPVTTEPTEPPVTTEPTEPPVSSSVGAVGQEGGGTCMSAVVIGGTGAVGRALVSQLLTNKTVCNKVTVFGRRDINQVLTDVSDETHGGRLVQCIGDLDSLTDDTIKTNCTGANVFFCCIGTTKSAAGSAQEFHRIEHDVVMRFARLAKETNIPHLSLVSSTGANANSLFLYFRVKGEVERSILGLGFPYTTILRPGLLGRGTETRFREKIYGIISRAIPVATVAQAMIIDAYQYYQTNTSANNSVILTNADIYRIVNEDSTN